MRPIERSVLREIGSSAGDVRRLWVTATGSHDVSHAEMRAWNSPGESSCSTLIRSVAPLRP